MADVKDRRPGGGGASADKALYKDLAGDDYWGIADASFLYVWNTTDLDWEKVAIGSLDRGAANWNPNQVDVTGTATLICAARATRRSVLVENLGTTDVYLGGSGVTTTSGFLLVGTKGGMFTVPFTGAVYGITGGGTQRVAFSEVYD